jgi:hypothetical protein
MYSDDVVVNRFGTTRCDGVKTPQGAAAAIKSRHKLEGGTQRGKHPMRFVENMNSR